MVSRTMNRFDLHRKHPAACLHAVGPDASSTRTLLLSLSTIAGAKISNPPWVNFQSAGWVSFQSAPTHERSESGLRIVEVDCCHLSTLHFCVGGTLGLKPEGREYRHAAYLVESGNLEEPFE